MKILVTGSNGFVGKNLCLALKEKGHTVYKFDIENSVEDLKEYSKDCEFVFHLAGINRPKDPKEFIEGNFSAAENLLEILKANNNKCPIMISSSLQATLIGRYEGSDYGKSKLLGENLLKEYSKESGI